MKRPMLILAVVILVIVLISVGILIYLQLAAKDNSNQGTALGPVFETQEFTVNVSSSSSRYIKAQFALELSGSRVKDELNKKIVLLEDTVIMVLSRQTLDDLGNAAGKEALKASLIKEINSFLDKGQVTKVYFKNLIFS
jgi:flagellar basal body-associated protein FliL